MISSQFLIFSSAGAALLWAWAMVRLYREDVPIHWMFGAAFIMMLLGISAFYYEITYSLFGLVMQPVSRVIWTFVILTMAILAVSVLVYRR